MIPCKFYDPTSLRSSDLVKDWKSSHGRKWKMKLTAKERNDERVLWFFLSPLNDQKSPLKSWSCYMRAIGSNSIKIQDKILALGSIQVYPHKIFSMLLEATSPHSSRASRWTKLTKTENLRKERLSLNISKTYRRIFFRDCNFLPYLRKLISGHILTHADI